MASEQELDLVELKELAMRATRPNVQSLLATHIATLRTQMQHVKPVLPRQSTTPHYQILSKYAWDQEGTKVKVYFELPNVGAECKAEQVQFKCEREAVEVRLHNYRGANYLFAVKRLQGEVDVGASKYLLKSNHLVLTLIKKDKASWAQLAFKEDKFKAEEEEKKEADPQGSIMNLMKKMYDEGDANMKKTIAEAWTKANDKKGKGMEDM